MNSDKWKQIALVQRTATAPWVVTFIRGKDRFDALLRANGVEEAADISARLLRQMNGEPVEMVKGEVLHWGITTDA